MSQYLFILINPRGLHFETRVGVLPSVEHALQLAEMITQELSADPDHRWADWTLEVRNIHAQVSVIIPIQAAVN